MAQMTFRLTPMSLCDLVWRQIFTPIESELAAVRAQLNDIFMACEAIRREMAYNTGSISFASALSLYALARYVQPRTVFEIGTFIGKSTLSMGAAMDANNLGGTIYTCDGSNDFRIPTDRVKVDIVGYGKTMSTDALRLTAGENRKLELMHIDGRIGGADLEIISQIVEPNVIVALDDFEGIEKGVANWSAMRPHPAFARHTLVYPATESLLQEFGFASRSTTALVVPASAFMFGPQ